MRDQINKLSKHTMIYGVGVIIDKAVSFIMLPIYTRYLTPADYGVLELLSMTIDLISMIAGLGLTATIFKYYNEYDRKEEKDQVISTAALIMIVISLVTAIFGLAFSVKLSHLIFGQAEHSLYLRLFFVIYFLQSGVVTVPTMFLRAMQDSKLFVMINFIKLLFQVCFNIYFVIFLKKGILGILLGNLLAGLVIGLYLSVYMFRRVRFRFSFPTGKQMVRFGYPFIFVSLSSFVLVFSDRYFLNAFVSLDDVGIYSLAYKFSFLTGFLVVVPFEQIWEAQRFEIAKQQNALAIFKKVFSYFNIALISVSLLISLFVKDVLTMMADPSFHVAYKIVPIVVTAYIIQAWTFHCNLGIYIGNQSKYLAVGSILAAVGVTVFNAILIPLYGVYGAASAAVGAFLLRFLLIYTYSQKYYRIDYGWTRQVSLYVCAVAIYLVSRFLALPYLFFSICINFGLVLLFGAIVYQFFLDEEEKTLVRRILKKPFRTAAVLPKLKT